VSVLIKKKKNKTQSGEERKRGDQPYEPSGKDREKKKSGPLTDRFCDADVAGGKVVAKSKKGSRFHAVSG